MRGISYSPGDRNLVGADPILAIAFVGAILEAGATADRIHRTAAHAIAKFTVHDNSNGLTFGLAAILERASDVPETKLRLNLFRLRKGEQPEAVGITARVLIPENFELKKDDTLVFNFTVDPFDQE